MITREEKQNEIFRQLKKVIEQILQVARERDLRKKPEVRWETHLINELGVDSLEIMDLAAAVEKEFGITLEVQKFASEGTVRDIVSYILARIEESQ